MLSARAIRKSFEGREVLKGIDIDIVPGTITCLIGPSGSGKTTLLRTLCLLDAPDEGTVDIDGERHEFVASHEAESFTPPWPKVTAVFQSLFLWPHLTLRENIMLPARSRNEKVEKDIEGLVAFFEMDNFIDNYPNQGSLGQKQRVAMARALILNPQYLLLDEITSALDVEQTAKILAKLSQLKERNIGIFLITHALGFARRSADRIVFMDDGRILEQGKPEILEKPESRRLSDFVSMVAQAQ